MKRRVRITVQASPDHPEILTVRDALQQVLDFFDILTDDATPDVKWKLTLASTNSPLTVEGEPIDMRTHAGAYGSVEAWVAVVERNFARLASGQNFDDSFPREKLAVAKRILQRTTNGIGATVTKFSDEAEMITIATGDARRYFSEIDNPVQSLHSYLFSRTARREYGSVDGRIADIGTDYGQPAIKLVEHRSGREIWCRIDTKTQEVLAEDIKARDVWDRRRVRVRGALNYADDGKIVRILDGTVAFIEPTKTTVDELADSSFTEGYSVAEYLDRLRENEFGR